MKMPVMVGLAAASLVAVSLVAVSLAALACLPTRAAAAETLKIASPQPGSWESFIPVAGKQQGFFQKRGIDIEVFNTSGSGETMQSVISGTMDIGLSAGTIGAFGAHAKGAPVRIIGASETGSTDTLWYVAAKSPIKTIRDAQNATIAYSTAGASTHITVLRFISEYGLKATPVSTGNPAATATQVMSGQVDVGWAVAPFQLDAIAKGEARLVGRASDIAAIRGQTIRVQITNARMLAERKEAVQKFLAGYRDTLDWMYSSPEAVQRYMAFSGFSEAAVRLMLRDFIPKESLQMNRISGIKESMEDAVQFKFISAPLTDRQVEELIQIPAPQP